MITWETVVMHESNIASSKIGTCVAVYDAMTDSVLTASYRNAYGLVCVRLEKCKEG